MGKNSLLLNPDAKLLLFPVFPKFFKNFLNLFTNLSASGEHRAFAALLFGL